MFRYSLLTLVLALSLAGLSFGLARSYGPVGLILPLEALAACWAVASVCRVEQICGRRITRLTVLEILVIFCVLLILHGVMMPAYNSNSHRGQSTPNAVPVLPQQTAATGHDTSAAG